MRPSDLHFFPLALPFVLGLFLLMGLLIALIEVGILQYAYTKIGVDRRYVFLLLLLSLVGSYVNISVAHLPGEQVVTDRVMTYRCSGLLLESYAACLSAKPLSSQYSPKRHNTVSECMAKYASALSTEVVNMANSALITASATLHPFSLSQCSSRRTEGSRGDLDCLQDRGKHRPRLLPEEPFCRRRAV